VLVSLQKIPCNINVAMLLCQNEDSFTYIQVCFVSSAVSLTHVKVAITFCSSASQTCLAVTALRKTCSWFRMLCIHMNDSHHTYERVVSHRWITCGSNSTRHHMLLIAHEKRWVLCAHAEKPDIACVFNMYMHYVTVKNTKQQINETWQLVGGGKKSDISYSYREKKCRH